MSYRLDVSLEIGREDFSESVHYEELVVGVVLHSSRSVEYVIRTTNLPRRVVPLRPADARKNTS